MRVLLRLLVGEQKEIAECNARYYVRGREK